jgi:hypothetical protein
MGLFLVLRCDPSPRGDRSHNRLAARVDVNMLDGHLLLTFAAMAVERQYEGMLALLSPSGGFVKRHAGHLERSEHASQSAGVSASVKPVSARSAWLKRIRAPRCSSTWLASIGFGSVPSKLGGSILPELFKQFTVDGASP